MCLTQIERDDNFIHFSVFDLRHFSFGEHTLVVKIFGFVAGEMILESFFESRVANEGALSFVPTEQHEPIIANFEQFQIVVDGVAVEPFFLHAGEGGMKASQVSCVAAIEKGGNNEVGIGGLVSVALVEDLENNFSVGVREWCKASCHAFVVVNVEGEKWWAVKVWAKYADVSLRADFLGNWRLADWGKKLVSVESAGRSEAGSCCFPCVADMRWSGESGCGGCGCGDVDCWFVVVIVLLLLSAVGDLCLELSLIFVRGGQR